MEAKNKVFIISGYYVASDAKGKFKCDSCKYEKPWEGENYETMRCLNKTGKCNGRMRLIWKNGGKIMETGDIKKMIQFVISFSLMVLLLFNFGTLCQLVWGEINSQTIIVNFILALMLMVTTLVGNQQVVLQAIILFGGFAVFQYAAFRPEIGAGMNLTLKLLIGLLSTVFICIGLIFQFRSGKNANA